MGSTFIVFQNPATREQPLRTSKMVDFNFDQLGKLVAFDPTNIVIENPGVYTLVHIDESGFSINCRVIITN